MVRLYFYNNTIVHKVNKLGTYGVYHGQYFDLSDKQETVNAQNNIFMNEAATSGNESTEMFFMGSGNEGFDGHVILGKNWASNTINPYFVKYGETWNGTVVGMENLITNSANDAGFTNDAAGDYSVTINSPTLHISEPLDAEIMRQHYSVINEYVPTASGKVRNPGIGNAFSLGALDNVLGGTPAPTPVPTPTPTPNPNATPAPSGGSGSTPAPIATPLPGPASFPVTIFHDTQGFTFTNGSGTGSITAASGVNNSAAVKLTIPAAYENSVNLDYTAAPLNITGIQATDKLKISLDIGCNPRKCALSIHQ